MRLFTWKFVLETKNRTLEEIEKFWARGNGADATASDAGIRRRIASRERWRGWYRLLACISSRHRYRRDA
jgi:hypothetical protein